MTDNQQTRTARRKQMVLNKKKNKKKFSWKKIVLAIGVLFLAIGIGIGGLFAYYIASAPKLDAMHLTDAFSSKWYDMNGELIADLAGEEKRTKVEFDDLPDILVDAVTATEDVRFFKHPGIDIRRIGAAIKANITRGFGAEGASTITQQVIEKSFLKPDKKLKLKVQEQWLALKLEQEYSKEQILEMYLNKIFYGSHSYGVAEAAKTYFGKTDLHELTLVEAAMLAGLPQRPSAYNPYENPDLMAGRVETVLKLMVRHNKITQAEADEALKVDIASTLVGKQQNSTKYSAFIQQVQKEVKEKLGDADIYADGLKIYTTLDPDAQDHVEFLLEDSEDNPIPYPDDQMQVGLTVLDTKNGAVRAIGGRRNSKGDEFNYAIQGEFQAGSLAKTYTAYAPAIEYNKLSTYEQIHDDKPYKIGSHEVNNVDRKFHGWVSMRTALSQSYNIPALKILEETGASQAKKFAEGLGINFADDILTIGDAIGGTATLVTPMQIAGAYRAFGNEGIYNEPYAVTKIEFPDGRTIDFKPEPKAVMSDYTAYMITDMLKSTMTSGTGISANIPGLQVAGKTGTTNLSGKEGALDIWFAGYTTNYTISVWGGGYTDENNKLDVMPQGARPIARLLFKNIMTELSKNIQTKDFVKPNSVVELAVERGSNPAKLPSKHTSSSNTIKELFVRGYEPSETSKKFNQLDPVTNLKATFEESSNKIKVNWSHSSDEDVSFEVSTSINGGQMKQLSVTKDKSIEISEAESNATYVIQVVAISGDGSFKSKPQSTTIKIGKEDENISPVNGLSANYKDSIIDVTWKYNGPAASFEVDVNGEKQTVQSNGIEITGAKPGQSYTITVTPIGKKQGVRGESRSITETIPPESKPDPEPDPTPVPDENEDNLPQEEADG